MQDPIISTYANELDILRLTPEGPKTTGRNDAKCRMKKQDIYPFLNEKTVDDDWKTRTQRTSLGYLLYKNGWMDLKPGKFYSSAEYEYSPEIVFTYALNHDFVTPIENDLLYMKTIRERLFCSSLGENTDHYFMLQIARGLGGDIMKRILFGLGVSNSGKGVSSKAILLSCGQYAGSFNAENMSFNKSSDDEAQKLRWAFAFNDKRIILSNKIINDIALNGNMTKKLASGGGILLLVDFMEDLKWNVFHNFFLSY